MVLQVNHISKPDEFKFKNLILSGYRNIDNLTQNPYFIIFITPEADGLQPMSYDA